MRIQCPKCKATSGEIQCNQIVSRTVTFHLDSSSEDGIGDVTTKVFESGPPTEVQCNECGYEGTAEEFGFKIDRRELSELKTVEIKDRFGYVIHRGKGLRVLRNYISRARRERAKFSMNIDHRGWPVAVGLRRNINGSGDLHISFGDCSYSNVHFEKYSVMYNTVSNWKKLKDIPTAFYSE